MTSETALRRHWPEYLIEACLLGAFMVSALGFTVLLEHPASPVRGALPHAGLRRALMGLAMGGSAIALVYSPWGQRSGAHFNPALTLAFFRLGKIEPADALGYVAAQFAGGVVGVLAIAGVLGSLVAAPTVNYAATLPGAPGPAAAFAAELAISFATMLTVLTVSNHPRLAPHTPLFVGALVATWISFEAPLSGMSMNPARSFGSAAGAGLFDSLWIYFAAPALGMLLAAETFVRVSPRKVHCAKLHHANATRCIFRCGYHELAATRET